MSGDLKRALGTKIPAKHRWVKDVANKHIGLTGKVHCYYGTHKIKGPHPVALAIAQYKSAHAAKDQLGVTTRSEIDHGAAKKTVKVAGHPATVLLRDGGLLTVRVNDWTLSIAIDKGVVKGKKRLVKALQKLGNLSLSRLT
jgi:hypothetical protein